MICVTLYSKSPSPVHLGNFTKSFSGGRYGRLRTLTKRPSVTTVVASYFFASGSGIGSCQPDALMIVRFCDTSAGEVAGVAAALNTGTSLCSACRHPIQTDPNNA